MTSPTAQTKPQAQEPSPEMTPPRPTRTRTAMLEIALALAALFVSPLSACTSAADVQCETDEHCNRSAGGQCTTSATGSSWCTYTDGTCESGRRWSDLDVGEGLEGVCVGGDETADAGPDVDAPRFDAMVGIDSGVDAGAVPDAASPPSDASPIIAWDIVYINDLKSGDAGDFDVSGIARIVNTGTTPVDLSTLEIVTMNHNGDPSMNVTLSAGMGGGPFFVVPPGQAAGLASGVAAGLINVLITEPSADTTEDLLSLTAANTTPGVDADYMLTASISIEGLTATLLISVDDLAFGSGGVLEPTTAERVSAQ